MLCLSLSLSLSLSLLCFSNQLSNVYQEASLITNMILPRSLASSSLASSVNISSNLFHLRCAHPPLACQLTIHVIARIKLLDLILPLHLCLSQINYQIGSV